MTFTPTFIDGLYIVEPKVFDDERGWFMRTYCKSEFSTIGHTKEWVQMNHSYTLLKGTIRGMHFQVPDSEIKLVRCIAGSVWDVAVDLRRGSKTFLKWYAVELNQINKRMLYIPGGFAHGFQVLTENSELVYLHTDFYLPKSEGGLRYDDPTIGIEWPLDVSAISQRDLSHRLLGQEFKGF